MYTISPALWEGRLRSLERNATPRRASSPPRCALPQVEGQSSRPVSLSRRGAPGGQGQGLNTALPEPVTNRASVSGRRTEDVWVSGGCCVVSNGHVHGLGK